MFELKRTVDITYFLQYYGEFAWLIVPCCCTIPVKRTTINNGTRRRRCRPVAGSRELNKGQKDASSDTEVKRRARLV